MADRGLRSRWRPSLRPVLALMMMPRLGVRRWSHKFGGIMVARPPKQRVQSADAHQSPTGGRKSLDGGNSCNTMIEEDLDVVAGLDAAIADLLARDGVLHSTTLRTSQFCCEAWMRSAESPHMHRNTSESFVGGPPWSSKAHQGQPHKSSSHPA